MKVLLITTISSPESVGIEKILLNEPLALEYIGAGIRDHHDVKLLDLRVETEPRLEEILETFQPDIVGCGGTTADVFPIRRTCAEIKRIIPGVLTVVGGHHASFLPQDFFDENIDVVVMGEGVGPFKKICECHEKQESFQDIENIYYQKDGKMVFTFKKAHPPLDSLPFPDRTLTSHIRDQYYFPLTTGKALMANIRSSIGCIYRCNFCSIARMMDYKVYTRDIDKTVEELASIKEPHIYWIDDEFLLYPERAIAIARAIKQAGIKKTYAFYGRSDSIVKHPQCIEEWAEIGLLGILVGVESHRDRDLKNMKKGITTSINAEAIRICRENHVVVRGNFMIYPDYKKRDFRILAKASKKSGIDMPAFTILTPFPGTDLYDEVKENLITSNYNLFDVCHAVLPTKLPLKKFYKEYSRIFFNGVPMKRKIAYIRETEPKARRQFIAMARKLHKRLRAAYKDHEVEYKSLDTGALS